MGKKIIVLNGSPRKNGNTASLVSAFTKAAEANGNNVTAFFLDELNIKGCKGCYGGGKDIDSPCQQKDDMEKIYPVYREADVVVIASPLYFWTLSGQLRTAFDRLFAVSECSADYHTPAKESILLMAAGGDDFDDVRRYYENLMKFLGWKNLGAVLAGGVNNIGDVEGKPALEDARILGAAIR